MMGIDTKIGVNMMGRISKILALFLFTGLWVTIDGYAQNDRFIISGSADNTVQKINDSGTIVWTYSGHTQGVLEVTADSAGNVYTASVDGTVRKLDSNGTLLWTYSGHTSAVSAVAVDLNGNVYTGSNDASVHKIDSTGTQIWTFNGHTLQVLSVAVDADGNVYSGSDDNTLRKLDSLGTQLWSYTQHTDGVRSVKVDLEGNVYSASDDQTVHKIDTNGNQIWTYTGHTDFVWGVDVDFAGNVYTASLDTTAHKIDPNGNQIWVYSLHTGWVNDVKVDRQGNVYTASNDQTVHKIDANGTQVWTYTGHTNTVYTVAVEGDILNPVTLLSPENEAFNTGLTPTLSWEALPGAETYELVLSTDQTFTNTNISEINLPQTTYDVINSLTAETVYYWRVRGVEQNGIQGEWSAVFSFNTAERLLHIYSGSRDNSVHKIDPNGNQLWTYTGHTANINEAVSDSDGTVYTASADNTVHKIGADGLNVWTYSGHTFPVESVAFDLNGNVFSGGGNGVLHKTDSTGTQAWIYSGHSSSVLSVATDQANNIFTGSADNSVHKVDQNGANVWIYSGHTAAVNDVATDKDGNIYSASADNSVHKINANGTNAWIYSGHTAAVTSVAVDTLGNVYATSSDNSVHKIDAAGTFVWNYPGHSTSVLSVSVDDDGNVYTASADNTIHKVNSTGTNVWTYTLHTDWVTSVDAAYITAEEPAAPLGPVTLTSPADLTTGVSLTPTFEWQTLVDAQTYEIQVSTVNDFATTTISESGITGTTFSSLINLAENTSYFWRVRGVDSASNPGEWSAVFSFTTENKFQKRFIVSGSQDNTVHKLDELGRFIWSFTGHTSNVEAVAIDTDGNVYTGSVDNTVRKIDVNGNEVWNFTGHTLRVRAVAIDTDGNVYSASDDNTVRKINSNGVEVWSFTGHTSAVFTVAVDTDGNVYSGSVDNTVRKIDSNGVEIWSFAGHTANVQTVAVDIAGNVYSGSQDNTVRKIDVNGVEVWSFTGHTSWVRAVTVDAEGNVYSGSDDTTVRKIDSNGVEAWSFTEHTSAVSSVALDTEGNVYSGSFDTTVRKIDANGSQLWRYAGHSSTVYATATELVSLSESIALASPLDQAIDQPTQPTFQWESQPSAVSYTIEVTDDALFSNLVIEETTTETSYTPTINLASGREYRWQVYGLDANGNRIWSDVYTFMVEESDRFIFSGSSDNSVKKLDLNGTEVWSYNLGTTVNAVVADDLGNVYGAGGSIIHKIDETGTQVWTYNLHTSTITSLAIDDEGFIYSGSFDNTVHKIDPNGNQMWTYDLGTTVRALATDEGNVYATATFRLDKINRNGLQIWSKSTGISNAYVLETDAQGNIYINSDANVLKLDSSGNTVWTYTEHLDAIRGLAVDLNGNIYSGSLAQESEVHKIGPNGNKIWVYSNQLGGITSLEVDFSGFIYSASMQDSTGANSVHQINQNGENVWIYGGHTNNVNSVSVSRESSTQGQVVLSQPSADSLGVSVRPEFSWVAISGASTYELRVSRSNIFEGTSVRENGISETSFSLPFDLQEQRDYYWRVRGVGADGTKGEWSEAFRFTTEDLAFAGGDGSVGNPYQISTAGQLQLVRDNSDQNFILLNDIDARTTREWNSGAGFNPIGDNVVRFSGRFNGNGYTISNLFINRPSIGDVGIFGNANSQSVIENVNVSNVEIVDGSFSVGGLAGYSDGTIRNVSVSGSIRDTGNNTGGIVGAQGGAGLLTGSNSSVNIDANSQSVGGLVGEMFGRIEYSFSTGTVIGGVRDVGGLVGRSFNNTVIIHSYATGDVSSKSTSNFIEYYGGLIGRNESLIGATYSTGNLDINGNYIGGFVGDNTGNGDIIVSFSTGSVNGRFATGGFAGRNNGSIEESYALGDVNGGSDTGGFVGENNRSVTNVFAKGNVVGDDQVGGLIGGNRAGSIISKAYAWGSVTGVSGVGGLVGVNPEGNEARNSYSKGLVTGTEDVGGFIGLNAGVIDSSYWDSEASGRASGIGRGTSTGVTGLNTADMTGENAVNFMTLFNFEQDWQVTDIYPALIWETIGVPRLISPANNALSQGLFPEFEWSIDSEAVSYDLQVGRTSTFPESLALNETGITTNTYSPTTELSPGANYSWRVRIEKTGGEKGDWSEPFNFTTAATVNAANSSIAVTSPHLPDGVDTSVVTVRLRNDFNVLVGGFTEADFNITVTGGAQATPIAETTTAGVYMFELTSSTPTVATVQVVADGVQLDDEPLVIFTDTEPELFLFSTSLDSTVRRTDIDGNSIWSQKIDIESGLRTSTVTPSGDLYVGGLNRPDIFRFDLNGNLEDVITISGGNGIFRLTSDEEGFIYAATASSNTYKISPTGTVLWSHGGDQNGDYNSAEDVVYDPEGFVYVAHWGGNVKKFDKDGNLIWEFIQGNENGNYDLVSIAVDNVGNVLVGNSNGALRKLDSNGQFLWEYNEFTNFVFEIAFDSENNVYAGGADSEVHKLDQDGNPLWVSSTDGRWVEGINVDRNNNLFVGAWRTLLKLDIETGGEIWSNDSHLDQIRGVTTGYFIQTGTGLVTLNQPANQVSNVSLLPIYEWEPASNASTYRFQLSTDAEFSNVIVNLNGLTNTMLGSGDELAPETTYYWRTRGVDGLGIAGPWSDIYSFTTLGVNQVYAKLIPELGIQNPNAPLELRFNFGIVFESVQSAVTITDSANTTYTLVVDEPNTGQFMISTAEGFFAGDQITVNVNSSLLQSSSGFDITGNDTTYTFNTSFLGDFSETGSVEAEDLMQLASRWRVSSNDQNIAAFDIGPATGTPPRLKSNPDGVINFEDLIIFAFSWNRSLGSESGEAMASAPLSGLATGRVVDQELDSYDELREITSDRNHDMESTFALSYGVDDPFADFTDRLDRYYAEIKSREEKQSREKVQLRTPARTGQYQRMNEQEMSGDRTMALVLSEDHLLQGYELLVNLPDGVSMENVRVNSAFEQHGGQTFSLKQTSSRGFMLSAANLGQPLELSAGDTLATFTANSSDTEVVDMSIAYTLYQTPDKSEKGMYNAMADIPAELPDQFQVLQNFPNPFNPTTEIRYQLPEQAEVRIRVYDILGRLVFTIAEQKVEAGFYQVNWDASRFASGVYLYVIQARGASGQTYMQTKKMTLIK